MDRGPTQNVVGNEVMAPPTVSDWHQVGNTKKRPMESSIGLEMGRKRLQDMKGSGQDLGCVYWRVVLGVL